MTRGATKGEFGKGDFAKGDSAKGDFAKGDHAKADFGKGDFAKGAFAKGKHLLAVLRMAHVVVLESADATCDVLCLAKQAKGDLNKVYLRQNNGKPRTKKVFDLHPTPETWFNLVFKCVKEHPDKKTVIMCDSKAACEKLERIFDAFLFDCLGRHPHDARFARIQVRVP